jgi:D-alanyl-D-alanine dipeptidase
MKLIDIPSRNLGDWKKIPIHECGEKLISLDSLQIRLEPIYFQQGIKGSIAKFYLRESVVVRLERVLTLLPKSMELIVWDGWRPLATQQALFDMFKTQISSEMPTLSDEELIKHTSIYVSLPSSDPKKPSPHNTGGAVDLTIAYRGGDLLNMGTDFDDFTEKARTTFFEMDDSALTTNEILYRDNRRLLYSIMTEVGFTNYPEEWWHFDYGNQFWASISGAQNALYSNIEPENGG